jgi:hypothetical protein
MNWKNIENGYEFRIHFKHGQDGARVVEKINCSLDEQEFNKIFKIVSHLGTSIEKYFDTSLEKIVEDISKKTDIDESIIMKTIENIVLSDFTCEEGDIAEVDYFEIYRFEDGKVLYFK